MIKCPCFTTIWFFLSCILHNRSFKKKFYIINLSNFRKWQLGGHLQKCDKGQVMHPVPIATQYTNMPTMLFLHRKMQFRPYALQIYVTQPWTWELNCCNYKRISDSRRFNPIQQAKGGTAPWLGPALHLSNSSK